LQVETLENRYAPTVMSAAVGFEVQTVADSNSGSPDNLQYVSAGSFQTVSNLQVNVTAADAGLFNLAFTGYANSSSSSDLLKLRYLLDGQIDPNDVATNYNGGQGSDLIVSLNRNSYGDFTGMNLTRQLQLTAGMHTVSIQVEDSADSGTGGKDLMVRDPSLQVTGYNSLNGQSAAVGYQNQIVANENSSSGANNIQEVSAGNWQTICSIGPATSLSNLGLYDLAFTAYARSNSSNDLIRLRYLIDGYVDSTNRGGNDPSDQGSDLTETMIGNSYGNWIGLNLTRQLTLGGPYGATISIQMEDSTSSGSSGQDLEVWDPALQVTAYNNLDYQTAASSTTAANPNTGDSNNNSQYVAAGFWQTVSTLQVNVNGAAAGLFAMAFTAYAQSNSSSDQVEIRYLLDGALDPNDVASNEGNYWFRTYGRSSDLTESMTGNSYGNWVGLTLTRQLQLGAGMHTISIQVESWASSGPGGQDLELWNPSLQVTGGYIPIPDSEVADFQGHGVWVYGSSGGWQQLSPAEATQVALDDYGDVLAAFGNGVWIFYAGASDWQYLSPAIPTQIDIAGRGIAVGEFPGNGVWMYGNRGNGWDRMTPADALTLAVDDQGDFVASFPGNGTWINSEATSGWRLLTMGVATQLSFSASGNGLAASIPGSGTWWYEIKGSPYYHPGWYEITPAVATSMAVGNQNRAAFAFGNGVWMCNCIFLPDGTGQTWQYLNPALPSQMGIANISDLFAEFPGSGVWENTSSGGWLQLTAADARLLRGAGG
jgi:hypothetical protein